MLPICTFPLPFYQPESVYKNAALTPRLFTDLIYSPSKAEASPSYCNMAKDFLETARQELSESAENAKNLNLGKLIVCVPKLLIGSLHCAGKFIQGGHDYDSNFLRFGIGGFLKLTSNVADFTIEITRVAIDLSILTAKKLGACFLGSLCVDLYIYDRQESTHSISSSVDFISLKNLSRLIEITNSTDKGIHQPSAYGVEGLPIGYEVAALDEIPNDIMARRAGTNFSGEKLNLRKEENLTSGTPQKLMVLRGDAWSALRVGVYKNNGKFILCFQGTDPMLRPGTLKSDLNILLGVRDRALDDANILVKAFVKRYGAENIELVGHSLGGSIAADAGLRNGVKVRNFNALGLSLMQRIDLRRKINAFANNASPSPQVTHLNTRGDILSQSIQPYLLLTKQVGTVTTVPGNAGHDSMEVARDVMTANSMFLSKMFPDQSET